jgi:hypothetical protein
VSDAQRDTEHKRIDRVAQGPGDYVSPTLAIPHQRWWASLVDVLLLGIWLLVGFALLLGGYLVARAWSDSTTGARGVLGAITAAIVGLVGFLFVFRLIDLHRTATPRATVVYAILIVGAALGILFLVWGSQAA